MPLRHARTAAAAAAATLLLLLGVGSAAAASRTVAVGADPTLTSPVGWTDSTCYVPIPSTLPADRIQFDFAGYHDVHKMASKLHFDTCDFTDAVLLATVGQSPYRYTITEQDANDGSVYFACGVGAHCSSGRQKLRVNVDATDLQQGGGSPPVSQVVMGGISDEQCQALQDGASLPSDVGVANVLTSTCTDPILQDDGRYFVTCLSSPATLTPGGVINENRIVHYPYPTDRRVKVGLRTWEFVSGDPDSSEGIAPVPVNQLYVHHLSSGVVLGQGAEGIRRTKPDAPFPEPYGLVSGDEGDFAGFHLIDLREVGDDEWLACIECRCSDGFGTYLDGAAGAATASRDEFGVATAGGVPCCTNCTSLAAPTVDYRMRYNVTYSDISDTQPVSEIIMVTADISPAAGKNFEFDVPQFEYLPDYQKKDGHIQRIERVGKFSDMFKMGFFGEDYAGPDAVRIFRCVGHLHVAAVGMWLEDVETGEIICKGIGTHGTNPEEDEGFLTAISVDSFDEPVVLTADREVRLVTEYNATVLHTGVMGMFFLFLDGENDISRSDADLSVDLCTLSSCDAALIPPLSLEEQETCFDALPTSPACRFANMCDCEEFVNAPESTGCGGVYTTNVGLGDIPVNDMCFKYCGCPQDEEDSGDGGGGGGGPSCVDTISTSPACKFGSICDCEALVNDPESTGCGGELPTQMGPIVINDLCPNYCDACPEVDVGSTALLEESLVDQLEESLLGVCKYATDHCRLVLTNLHSCGDRWAVKETEMEPVVQTVLTKHAQRLALKHSKLGHPSLHVDDVEREIKPCVGGSAGPSADYDAGDHTMIGDADFDGSSSLANGPAYLGSLAAASMFVSVVFTF